MPVLQKKCLLEKVAMGPALEVDTKQMCTMIHYRESWVDVSAFYIACAHTHCTHSFNCESTVNILDILQLNRILSCC